MGSARARLLSVLRRADRFGRLRVYTPVTVAGRSIYVHAKIMIVDDRLIRVGSSNLNNRSMGYDTECDLAIEAASAIEAAAVAAAIASCRDDLLGEHLGVEPGRVSATLARTGSLVATVEELRRNEGRTLRPFDPPPVNAAERFLADHELLDPERPRTLCAALTRSPLLHRLRRWRH